MRFFVNDVVIYAARQSLVIIVSDHAHHTVLSLQLKQIIKFAAEIIA